MAAARGARHRLSRTGSYLGDRDLLEHALGGVGRPAGAVLAHDELQWGARGPTLRQAGLMLALRWKTLSGS